MSGAAPLLARPKVWFAAHGITHIHRVVTDNGACYRSNDLAGIIGHRTRHQRTRPYTPRHNGKAERYQQTMAEEVLYVREYTCKDQRPTAISVWTSTTTTIDRTVPRAGDRQPLQSRPASPNVRLSYS